MTDPRETRARTAVSTIAIAFFWKSLLTVAWMYFEEYRQSRWQFLVAPTGAIVALTLTRGRLMAGFLLGGLFAGFVWSAPVFDRPMAYYAIPEFIYAVGLGAYIGMMLHAHKRGERVTVVILIVVILVAIVIMIPSMGLGDGGS